MTRSVSTDQIHIIALCGKARSGKTTVANFLGLLGGFKPIALAGGVRSALDDIDGPTWEQRKERGRHGMTERRAMQLLGTECREYVDVPNHWLDHFMIKLIYCAYYHPVPTRSFVVPDLRHPHEDEYLRGAAKMLDGRYELWSVTRPGVVSIAESGHSGETSLDSLLPDRDVLNDGTLTGLQETIRGCLGLFVRGIPDGTLGDPTC